MRYLLYFLLSVAYFLLLHIAISAIAGGTDYHVFITNFDQCVDTFGSDFCILIAALLFLGYIALPVPAILAIGTAIEND